MLIVFSLLFLALLLDAFLGETPVFHPLIGFGKLANFIERKLNQKKFSNKMKMFFGFVGWILLVLPLPLLYFYFHQQTLLFYIVDTLILYFAIGLNSLKQHALNIYLPLVNGEINKARKAVGMIVSRQTGHLNETQISRATVESVLENGHDAVIASLFWFVIGGVPMVLIHRLSNTLDAMWGYRTERFLYFGRFSAKVDDLLGWPSAKVSALFYVLGQTLNLAKIKKALSTASRQAQAYKSLNGGWVMAAGASVLNIKLGGSAIYDNKIVQSVELGQGQTVVVADIKRSLILVEKACWFFVFAILVVALLNLILLKV